MSQQPIICVSFIAHKVYLRPPTIPTGNRLTAEQHGEFTLWKMPQVWWRIEYLEGVVHCHGSTARGLTLPAAYVPQQRWWCVDTAEAYDIPVCLLHCLDRVIACHHSVGKNPVSHNFLPLTRSLKCQLTTWQLWNLLRAVLWCNKSKEKKMVGGSKAVVSLKWHHG